MFYMWTVTGDRISDTFPPGPELLKVSDKLQNEVEMAPVKLLFRLSPDARRWVLTPPPPPFSLSTNFQKGDGR